MNGFPSSCSWTMRPRMPIWAARPWLSSLARSSNCSSLVWSPKKPTGTAEPPKSPGKEPSACFHKPTWATEVSREGAFSLLPQADFQHTNETNNLGNTGSRDAGDGCETSRDVRELGSREVDISREADSSPGGLIHTNKNEWMLECQKVQNNNWKSAPLSYINQLTRYPRKSSWAIRPCLIST